MANVISRLCWSQDLNYSDSKWVLSPKTGQERNYMVIVRDTECLLFRMRNSRHSFSSMLIANGENVKVVQEVMRHSNCHCTLEIYSQARLQAKRDAQHRIIEMIVPGEREITGAKESLVLGNDQPAGIELL